MNSIARSSSAPPCSWACPVETDAAGYVSLIAEGRYREAYEVARRPNPLAAVCARVCTAPCEEVCCRADLDVPIAIRALKRFLTDRFEVGDSWIGPAGSGRFSVDRGDERVAVIGSGPAGLACAYDLALKGYEVTIFEAAPVPGGMLRHAIPESRLPVAVVEKEIDALLALGVRLLTNTRLGREFTLTELWIDGFSAVFLALGAGRSCASRLSAMKGPRLFYGVEFLRSARLGIPVEDLGKTAIIAGAAATPNTLASTVLNGEQANLQRRLMMSQALDVARVARLSGATQVTVCTVESASEWPAEQAEIERAKRGGVRFRQRVVAEKLVAGRRVAGVDLLKVSRVFNEEGHFAPVFQFGRRRRLRVDSIILVTGRTADLSCLHERDGIATHGGRIIVDPDTLATTAPLVFAGGDAAFGSRDVASAIADGKTAATSIDRALRGGRRSDARRASRAGFDPIPCPPTKEETRAKSVGERIGKSVSAVAFSEREARREALRCLQCAQFPGEVEHLARAGSQEH